MQMEYSKLDHAWQWKETPEQETLTVQKFDDMMLQSSRACESFLDKMAGIKGQISARVARSKSAS